MALIRILGVDFQTSKTPSVFKKFDVLAQNIETGEPIQMKVPTRSVEVPEFVNESDVSMNSPLVIGEVYESTPCQAFMDDNGAKVHPYWLDNGVKHFTLFYEQPNDKLSQDREVLG